MPSFIICLRLNDDTPMPQAAIRAAALGTARSVGCLDMADVYKLSKKKEIEKKYVSIYFQPIS